jgi:Tfp pilus assembly protein PilE
MENLRRNYSGFTFIEIISVLIITSILFGISAAVGTAILEKSKQERIIFNMYRIFPH